LPGAPFKPAVGLSGVVAGCPCKLPGALPFRPLLAEGGVVAVPLPLHLLLPLLLTSEASLY